MASMSVSGVISGMDWDSMIDEIITNAAKPAQVKVNKKTNLTNKKSLFEEMKVTMNSLQSSLSPLKLPSTYKAKEINIERVDTSGSYKGVLTATANADAEVNVWDVKVNNLATAQINRSKQITSSTLSSTLNGLSSSTFYVNMGGQKVGIEVNATDTLQALKSRINNTLKTLDNPLAVTASVVDNKLILKSDDSGLGTRTATETINYSSSGINTLSNISVNDSDAGNLKITKGSTSYTYGTDFTVANGNEIRWKQYDRSTEVALNDTVNVKYRMAAGDVYKSTGTYGSSEAEIKNFSVKDFGTLSSRVKITDGTNDYTYGKDFTITNNKVVWLDEEEAATYEPDSYTVSYNKTQTFSSSIAGTKKAATTTSTSEPDSYIVRYDDKATGSYTQTATANDQHTISIDLDFDELSKLYKASTGEELTLLKISTSSSPQVYCIDPSESARSAFSITDGNKTYEYGRDFVLRTKDNTTDTSRGNWQLTWGRNSTTTSTAGVVNAYTKAKGITGTAQNTPASGQVTFSYDYDYDYTRTARVNASDNDKLLTTVFGSDFDMTNFKSEKLTIRGYTYGTDYEVDTDGEIKWLNKTSTAPSRDDAITDPDFTALTAAYNQAYGSSVPTVTLTDADGVLRTYLDPEDASAFTMTSGSKTYEYGKDYVIRVNDDRSGYTISWAITNDANSDGAKDINDASTVVTTYTQYKDLSTYDMKEAPADNASYNFSFSKDVTTKASKTVNASASDTYKTIANIFSGITVDPADYNASSVITITDSNGNTYTPGAEYTIDSAGKITWLEKTSSAPSSFTATYTVAQADITPNTGKFNHDVLSSGGAFPKIDTLMNYGFNAVDLPAGNITARIIDVYDPSSTQDYKFEFSLKNSDGSYSVSDDYVYGRDYVVRKSEDVSSANKHTLISFYSRAEVTAYKNHVASDSSTYGSVDLSGTQKNRPGDDYRVSLIHNASSTDASSLSSLISEASGNYAGITITGNNGTTYTYSSSDPEDLADNEFTIVDGAITFKPASSSSYPTGEYTLIYEAFDPFKAAGTYSSATQAADFTTAEGYGNIDGNKLSYEQILKYVDISPTSETPQSKIDESMKKYFTLTDGTTTYTYGTDYRIIKGIAQDSDSSEYQPMIEWISGGRTPSANFTLTFTGGSGEVLTTDGVKRSATDTITGSPLAADFDGGTNTITYSGKTFYEGVDFNITKDSDGYATVTWISDSDGGTEWFYPDSGAYYTLNHTDDDGNTTSYNAYRTSSATLNMADYGMTTANGSLTVQYGDKLGLLLDADSQYDDDGNAIPNTDGRAAIKAEYSIDISDSGNGNYNFRWVQPTLTSRSGLPSLGDELTVEYEYDANTFTITGEAADLLGLNDDVTEAQDAELVVDGQTVYRASNDIGADYDNELIKGVTMHLKGVGEVSLDIEHDAEKAVESIQSFVDTYNELMSWMNTRMSEKQLDEDTAATVDSDDFRMRWGLLHGNSLLRNTKSQMRSLVSQNFTFSFTQRASSSEIYGTMAHNGLKSSSTLRLRIGTKYVDVAIDPTDTLQTIVAKINDDTKGGPMNDIYYDENGNKLQTPLLRASADNDVLTINSTSSDEITMSGSAAMNVLKMNYTYKGLYQIGIETTSDDYGKSGELVFDANEFMTALEDNPDEVQALMLKFVDSFGSWTKSMLNSSASGETSGTLTREIENIQTQIDSINEYLETYQERLDRMEENLRTRYGNTETQFAKLSQQANSISAILNQLNGTAQGGGYGQTSS